MIETKDLLLDKGKIDEWKSMYENVWKHEETAKYLMWEAAQTEEDGYEVVTAPEDFAAVRDELQAKGYEFISADVKLIPQTTTELTDETQLKMMNFSL